MHPRRHRLSLGVLLACLLGLFAQLALPATARADDDPPSSWKIDRYVTDATVGRDGTADVITTIDFDFANDAGHGPYLTFPTRMAIQNDRDHWRMIDVSDVQVSSPSGAPATLKTSEESGSLMLRVGDQKREVSGVQTYVVHYRLRGIVDPSNPVSGLDEVNWNAVGDGWTVPLDNITVTIRTPFTTTRTACFVGANPCTEASQNSGASTFRQGHLDKGQWLQTVVAVPKGSFVGAEPRLTHRVNPLKALTPTGLNGLAAALVALLGGGLLARSLRRHGRDLAYQGLTPGLSPAPGSPAEASIGRAQRRAPVAVQFTPPAGTTPGEVGTLIDEKADSRDVVATIIDLAVRGHLRVEQTGTKAWRFTRLGDGDGLLPHEKTAHDLLFDGKDEVTSEELATAKHAGLLPDTRTELYRQVTERRSWFRSSPEKARQAWLGSGVAVTLVGGGLVAGGMFLDLALPGAVLAALGVVTMLSSSSAPSRTAEGSAVLAQARGFELYLRTAEADQLRFEEGEDIFSRYLPWAIMLGVADRWTALFEKLAAEGRYQLQPTWYAVYPGYPWGYGSLGHLGENMSSAMASSVQAASSSSSSGGSGFSGGGGFGGGGGGGW